MKYAGVASLVSLARQEAIKAGAGAIRIKAGALLFLSNYTCRFAHMT